MKYVSLITSIFLFYGCSHEKCIKQFSIEVIAFSEIKNKIEIYYVFNEEDPFVYNIKKVDSFHTTSSYDTLKFSFDNNYPNKLRIDLGDNPMQVEMKIDRITFLYGQKRIQIPGDLMWRFFSTNDYLKLSKSSKIQFFNIDGKMDPYIQPNKLLRQRMKVELYLD
ncbi:hypothetical protein SAMN05216480_101128 [Pustulibacterium marinum]|uniref:Uncharacterized protein n=1 Tax=Pustulibacterium marinum TaxID=1224947 RepID=A0A1I7ETR7_9FLAO|nr:hypothetical protein [Pustulibacterium marinum]SFU27288.1 hypothetical protein SAMN05216480_101128 [Pustulibacterium marinum]